MKLSTENYESLVKAITAVSKETSWSITGRALDALETIKYHCLRENMQREKGTFSWEHTENISSTLNLKGSCHYGSFFSIQDSKFTLKTCGGHSIEAIKIENSWRFIPDGDESTRSWGDLPLIVGINAPGWDDDGLSSIERSRAREDRILSHLN